MGRPRKIVEPEQTSENSVDENTKDSTEKPDSQPETHTTQQDFSSNLENRIVTLLKEYLEKNVYTEKSKAMYEDIVSFYGNFDSQMKEVIKKLNDEADYTKLLDTQLSKKTVEMECITLKKNLIEERAKLGLKFDEMQEILNGKLIEYDEKEKQMQKAIQDLNDNIDQKLKDFKSVDAKIIDNLEKFRTDMTKASNNEYGILQKKSVETIEDAKSKLEAIKISVVSFLKKCEEQNEALIEKVPEQKRKRDWKDYVIYVLSGLCVLSMSVIVFQTIFN